MGTNTAGALKAVYNASADGNYNVTLRYTTNGSSGGKMKVQRLRSYKEPVLEKTAVNEWKKITATLSLKAGNNNIIITNTGGVNAYLDQVIITPAGQEAEKFAVTIREAEGGYVESVEEAAEGETVNLSVHPNDGFVLSGWNIIHGGVTISDEGTFTMPDDIVTIEPIFEDTTIVYNLDFTNVLAGTLPPGWIVTQENDVVHSYPNSYGDGSRVMSGFPGIYPKAIYWRFNDCQYGTQADYPLTLKAGKYKLYYAMAAWDGTSTYKAQIFRGNTVIASGEEYASAPNAGSSTGTDLSSATVHVLEFEVKEAGNYIIKFDGVNTGWQGLLLTSCNLKLVPQPTGIRDFTSDSAAMKQKDGKYIINNRIIIVRNGKKYSATGATLDD